MVKNNNGQLSASALHAQLIQAALKGDVVQTQKLLEAGAKPDFLNRAVHTPLLSAIAMRHLTVARLLLEAGADPDKTDAQGNTALISAISGKEDDLVALLLKHGADPNKKDWMHDTPVFVATNKGTLKSIELLIGGGARFDDPHFSMKWTPLGWAACIDRLEAMELLIKKGADVGYAAQNLRDYKSQEHARWLEDVAEKIAHEKFFTDEIRAATKGLPRPLIIHKPFQIRKPKP